MKRLILSVFIGGAFLPLFAANCPVGGTTIFFANGVGNTFADALSSAAALRTAVNARVAQTQSIAPSCLVFGLAYDSPVITTNVTLIDQLINLSIQAGVISNAQVNAQFISQVWAYLNSLILAPPWFQQALGNVITNTMFISQPDLQTQVKLYQQELAQQNKVLVVSHSQGNLYVNQAYIVLNDPAGSVFSVVGVATPATLVAGNGPYVTLNGDIILLVQGSLMANTDNGSTSPCDNGLSLLCHNFQNSYLPGINSGPKILDDVIDALPVPLGVTKTGTGTGTLVSTPAGIDCGNTCIAAFPLLTNGLNTSITLAATENSGSVFAGWSGTCAQIGSVNGKSITFPILNSSVIQSFPEDCTATFSVAPSSISIGSMKCNLVVSGSRWDITMTASGTAVIPPQKTLYFSWNLNGHGGYPQNEYSIEGLYCNNGAYSLGCDNLSSQSVTITWIAPVVGYDFFSAPPSSINVDFFLGPPGLSYIHNLSGADTVGTCSF